jgi:hypothetical protein
MDRTSARKQRWSIQTKHRFLHSPERIHKCQVPVNQAAVGASTVLWTPQQPASPPQQSDLAASAPIRIGPITRQLTPVERCTLPEEGSFFNDPNLRSKMLRQSRQAPWAESWGGGRQVEDDLVELEEELGWQAREPPRSYAGTFLVPAHRLPVTRPRLTADRVEQ